MPSLAASSQGQDHPLLIEQVAWLATKAIWVVCEEKYILSLARKEIGILDFQPDPVSIPTAISLVVEMLKLTARETGRQYELKCSYMFRTSKYGRFVRCLVVSTIRYPAEHTVVSVGIRR